MDEAQKENIEKKMYLAEAIRQVLNLMLHLLDNVLFIRQTI